jgi:hypothetical protein
MLVYDDVFAWEGWGGKLRLASGKCHLRIYDLSSDDQKAPAQLRPILVVVDDIPQSRMSVRSCAGHVATQITRKFNIKPNRMLYLEYYPESRYGEHGQHLIPEKYEAVEFTWFEGGAIQPKWRTLQPPLLDVIKEILAKDSSPAGT